VNKETGKLVSQRMMAREEYVLLAAAKRGDSVAFETLCKQASSTVLHIAWRIMRNNEDAEDVLQESFQQAFIYLGSFNGASRFSTWLTRIAINAALMKLRKRNRLRNVSIDEPVENEESSTTIDIEARPESRTTLCPQGTATNPLRGYECADARNAKSNRTARA